jgi:hypothetical protein
MFFSLKIFGALLVLFAAVLVGDARAQRYSVAVTKHGKHGSFSIQIGGGEECRPACAPRAVWVPGHHETVCEQVWIEGCCRREWVPAVYRERVVSYGHGCDRVVRVCVAQGFWRRVEVPGHYEQLSSRVWIAGHWRA